MTTEQDLRAVLELLAKLLAADAFDTDGEYEYAEVAYSNAVNSLLDTHGPALLRAVEDARRYAWLVESGKYCPAFGTDGWGMRVGGFGRSSKSDLDAAIDAAIAEGDQA